MIAVDWGTTNFRAYRLDGPTLIDRMPSGPGILAVPPNGFPETLESLIAPWLDAGEDKILMAGMVGSRQGWVEAPYLPCPADLTTLAAATIQIPFPRATIRLVPGLSTHDLQGTPEVMRGEEVQLAGILHRIGPDALVCLPGTHSKWVHVAQGRIATFTTHLTGEAFQALRHHTILGRLMHDGPTHPGPFADGVDRATQPGGLLHHLFGARTRVLMGDLPEDYAASYLSGLLIGHEVAAAAPSTLVHIVGAPALSTLYAATIAQLGGMSLILDQDAAATGLARIAEHIRWT